MSLLIDEILTEMKTELGLTRYEMDMMVNTQFIALDNMIKDKAMTEVRLIYIGRFRPTAWLKYNRHVFKMTKEEHDAYIKLKRDNSRLEKSHNEQPSTPIQSKDGNMQSMSVEQ